MDEPTESAEELTDAEAPAEMADEAVLAEPVDPVEGVESEAEAGAEESGELLPTEDEFSLPRVLEAILFASQKPVSLKELQNFCKGAAQSAPDNPRTVALAKVKEKSIREAFDLLQSAYESSGRSFEVRETVNGWQLVTKPAYAPWLRQLFPENRPARLSAPAVETLAIIAYRQPITRADIEAVRGVAVDGVMQSLLDRELVKIAGRSELPGRPLLYETTSHFMEHFGLKDLEELPNGAELRRVKLPTAEPVGEPAVLPETPGLEVSTEEVVADEATASIDEMPASVEDGGQPETEAVAEILTAEPAEGVDGEEENRDEH